MNYVRFPEFEKTTGRITNAIYTTMSMKKEIHPVQHEAKVTCGCGNNFTIVSTQKEIKVGICWKCHPFYTGQQKFVDTAGRLERFKKKYGNYIEKLVPKKKS